jgi:hypothetical protein
MWRTRQLNELYMFYDELDIAEGTKKGRLMRLGRLFRMQELDPCRRLTVPKPEATQHEVA